MVFKKITFQNRYVALETPSTRDPPPFIAKAILNFHFDYLNPSLIHPLANKHMKRRWQVFILLQTYERRWQVLGIAYRAEASKCYSPACLPCWEAQTKEGCSNWNWWAHALSRSLKKMFYLFAFSSVSALILFCVMFVQLVCLMVNSGKVVVL